MLLAAHAHNACPASWFQQVVTACYNSACSHAGPWPHLHAPEAAAAAASVAGAGEDALGSPLMLSGGSTQPSCAGQSRGAPLNPAGTQHHLQHAHAQQHVSSSCAGQSSQSCCSAPAHRTQLEQQSCKRQQGPVRARLLRQNRQAALLLHAAASAAAHSIHQPLLQLRKQSASKPNPGHVHGCCWLLAHPRSSAALPANTP